MNHQYNNMDNRICIVEDDKDARFLLATNLSKLGYHLEIFSSGHPLVQKEDQWPDLFILDVELPGINGLEICKWIKTHEATKDIPVLFLSASPGLNVLSENVNADAYLQKPYEVPVLIEKINRLMQKPTLA